MRCSILGRLSSKKVLTILFLLFVITAYLLTLRFHPSFRLSERPLSDIVLPERLIAVFGLESSGTTFVTETLAKAVGARQVVADLYYQNDQNIALQHLSLPWGGSPKWIPPQIVPFVPAPACLLFPGHERREFPAKCALEAGLTDFVELPPRFFVNITSHVQYYQELLGVPTSVVIVVRDKDIHFYGKLKHARHNVTAAITEDEVGNQLVQQALVQIPSLILVSYESLMSLQDSYLFHLYKQLHIQSEYIPEFHNGNAKYIIKKELPP